MRHQIIVVLSDLLQAEVRDEEGQLQRLSEVEIKAFINLLATAGNETVTKLLATAVYWLGALPEQRQQLFAICGLVLAWLAARKPNGHLSGHLWRPENKKAYAKLT